MLHGPTPLSRKILRTKFCSGHPSLDNWFVHHALHAHRSGSTKVFAVHDDDDHAVGFYALSAGNVEAHQAPPRVRKGLGAHPIPIALLARLGVSEPAQGQGLGQALLKDALLRVDQAADLVGMRALLAHAKNEQARRFYMHFGFEPSPVDRLWMFLLMKDLRAALG